MNTKEEAIKITVIRGLSQAEYEQLKQDIQSLGIRVSLRYHKQKYAYGSIDIRPVKIKNGPFVDFTPEQVFAIRDFLDTNGLRDSTPEILNGPNAALVYANGFHYLYRVDDWKSAECELCGEPSTKQADGHDVCTSCFQKIKDYEDRLNSRVERLRASADKANAEAQSRFDNARQMQSMIPFGQPILVGHHSEKRHRRHIAKIDTNYRKGFEAMNRAKRKRASAKAAEENHSISSDDPAAVLKLRDEIEKLQALQHRMKQANRIIQRHSKSNKKRKRDLADAAHKAYGFGDKELSSKLTSELRSLPDREINKEAAIAELREAGFSEANAAALCEPDFAGRVGFADYQLRNNNSRIRQKEGRIADLQAKTKVYANTESEVQHGDVILRRDTDDNRLRLIFPGKPSAEVRTLLKSNGFRWSPRNKAWQRQLNANGEYAAKRVLEILAKGE